MEYKLESEEFVLSISPQIFETDINYPCNTILEVEIWSSGFSGKTTMDIDIKELAKFADDLLKLYENLTGEAQIHEVYGTQMQITFSGNGRGHINIKGYLQNYNRLGNEQNLSFENDIDQTCLREFCYNLNNSLGKYL